MDNESYLPIIESLIYVSEKPITIGRLCEILRPLSREQIISLIEELKINYEKKESGLQIKEIAEGYKIYTKPEVAPWIIRLQNIEMKTKLTIAALEVLAIVAYKQPITRAEIESIRGVNSDKILHNLIEKKLIRIKERRNTPGRPLVLGTTREFLIQFGLKDLNDLPPLEENAENHLIATKDDRLNQ